MIIVSKFVSLCRRCGKRIVVGERVKWNKGEKGVECEWPCDAPVTTDDYREVDTVKKGSMAEVARAAIRAGKSDSEVLDELVVKCGLDPTDPKKRTYPAWYRAELRRAEKLVGKPGTAAPSVSPDDLVRMISEAVQEHPGSSGAVDMSLVEKLIDDAVEKRVRPASIEVKLPDGKKPVKIEGAHMWFERCLRLATAGFPVYLWGPAGSGKTTAAIQVAHALKREFEIDTLDPSTSRSMIQGFVNAHGKPSHTSFTRCWTEGKVYIADEIDNAPGHVQSLKNSALANGHAPMAWGNVERHKDFIYLCTGNTPGRPTRLFPDRRPMSAAFADRLYFMHFPMDEAIEARSVGLPTPPPHVRPGLGVKVEPKDWVKYVQELRKWAASNAPTLMITPRASLAGVRALACGETPDEVADGLIFRGADEEIRRKAMNAVRWVS